MARDDETEIRVFLAPEVERVLVDNQTDLVDLLRRNGADVERAEGARHPPLPSGEKEPVTVLLATSALAVALTPLLTRLLASLSRKRVLVQETVPVAVEDSQGNLVRDAAGAPVVEWVDRKRFVETEEEESMPQSLRISGPLDLHVSYETSSPGGPQ
jgi:hypothetical protein